MNSSEITYKEKEVAFLYYEGKFIDLKSRKVLIRIFPNERKELKQLMRKNGVRFYKPYDEGLKKVLEFCDKSLNG